MYPQVACKTIGEHIDVWYRWYFCPIRLHWAQLSEDPLCSSSHTPYVFSSKSSWKLRRHFNTSYKLLIRQVIRISCILSSAERKTQTYIYMSKHQARSPDTIISKLFRSVVILFIDRSFRSFQAQLSDGRLWYYVAKVRTHDLPSRGSTLSIIRFGRWLRTELCCWLLW